MIWRIFAWGLGILLLGFSARGDDIITNGNFTVGKVHWHGDGDVTGAGGTIFILLKPDRWSVLSQRITAKSSHLELKVTYSLSNFCSLGHDRSPDDVVMPLTSSALKNVTGLSNRMHDLPLDGNAAWMVLLLSDEQMIREAPVTLSPSDSEARSFTVTFTADARPFVNEDLCFAFPPGKGMVTIANVQLLRSP